MPKKKREQALTDEALVLYAELVREYGLHLDWMRRQEVPESERRDQQLAIGLLAISVYTSAKAVVALYDGHQGDASLIFVRSQLEQAAKAEYFATRPHRARDFLDLEPFERYKLTEGYKLKEELRATIVAECKEAVRRSPRLLLHQSKPPKGKPRADFLAIREALKPPDMKGLLEANKWNFDLYVTVFLFGSLGIHGSINELRNYFDLDDRGTVRFQPEVDMGGPPDYLLQSMAYVIGFIGKIGAWFPGGNREAEVKALYDRHKALDAKLKALDA